MSDEEKEKLLKQHKDATKQENEKRIAREGGIQTPEKKEEKKD